MTEITKLKKCAKCHIEKPVDNFHRNKTGLYISYCRPCECERVKSYKVNKDSNRGINNITNEQKNILLENIKIGLSIKKIAVKMGIPEGRLYGWKQRGHLEKFLTNNTTDNKTNDEHVDDYVDLT